MSFIDHRMLLVLCLCVTNACLGFAMQRFALIDKTASIVTFVQHLNNQLLFPSQKVSDMSIWPVLYSFLDAGPVWPVCQRSQKSLCVRVCFTLPSDRTVFAASIFPHLPLLHLFPLFLPAYPLNRPAGSSGDWRRRPGVSMLSLWFGPTGRDSRYPSPAPQRSHHHHLPTAPHHSSSVFFYYCTLLEKQSLFTDRTTYYSH